MVAVTIHSSHPFAGPTREPGRRFRGRLGGLQKNQIETNINSQRIALENVQAAESAIRDADMVAASAVISFQDKAVADIRAFEPSLPCALVVGGERKGTETQWADALARRAKECGATILDLHYGMLSPTLVHELHQRGFKVWCWTVNDAAVMDALARWGVDAITTDHPDTMVRWRKRLCQ